MIRSSRLGRTAAVAAAAGCAALALASPALAQKSVHHTAQTCPAPISQQCAPQSRFSETTDGPLFFQFTADPNPPACAPAIAHWFIDGAEWGNHPVQPGQSDGGYYADVSPGRHTVAVQLEGMEGGCNTGAMSGWSGTVQIETNDDAKNGAS